MACGVTHRLDLVLSSWREVEEVLDAFNTFMRAWARPGQGLEEFGDVALFSIGGGGVVLGMRLGLAGGSYVLEELIVEFNGDYCTGGYCRAVFRVGRAFDAGERDVINRGLARIAREVIITGDGARYVIDGLVVIMRWVGGEPVEVALEAVCRPSSVRD